MTLELGDVPAPLRPAVVAALRGAGVADGHLSVQLVDASQIRELNREYRSVDRATDVLSFPIDPTGDVAGPRELGDVVICPQEADDVIEATVHGVLHLCGFDHEADAGEMMELQAAVLGALASESR